MALTLQQLNAAKTQDFIELTEFLVENSTWVLSLIAEQRPFSSRDALCDAIETEIRAANREDQMRLFKAHPELAGVEAQAGTMTPSSTGEQGRLRLNALGTNDLARLLRLNMQYQSRFGFPFIIALRRQPSLAAVFEAFEERLNNFVDQEIAETISEVMHVVRGRAAHIDCVGN
jgi:2-oxo-4-hydroxy-4-carboxy-5-ureidoimidazoline decarboxylase